MRWPRKQQAESRPWKLLLGAVVAGLLCGLLSLAYPFENVLHAFRSSFHVHKASGDIVLVAVDDETTKRVGRWPWPRRVHADLIDALTKAGAQRIYLDFAFEDPTNAEDDGLLAASLERSGRVILATRSRTRSDTNAVIEAQPLRQFRQRAASMGSIAIDYNYQNAVPKLPLVVQTVDGPVRSFAAHLADRSIRPGEAAPPFPVDYSLDPTSIPTISAHTLLAGKVKPGSLANKDVVVGSNSEMIGDQSFLPGWGRMASVYIHVLGAETLRAGQPLDLGWIPAFVLAIVAAAFATYRTRGASQSLVVFGAVLAILVLPLPLEMNLIFVEITPGLLVLCIVGSVAGWRSLRRRGLVNSVSGLPNLSALQSNRAGRDQALIAGRILNYAEIAAALPADQERQLIEQIVSRLRVGAPDRTLYQGDGGIFAWFEGTEQPVGNHVEALHSLFRNPAKVDGQPIDLAISFGVEIGSSRSLGNRLASALVAAEEAAHDGLKWKYHDPETLEDASWRLSMLSQLDSAVDKGEIWVAYQPKLDLHSRRVVGAEALARWTHPEKGPIAASEFIAAAEQHDRIGKLTDFVLEHAIRAAASLNRMQPGFGMAVNLSARLLADKGFILRLRAMLARHGLAPHLLTLELTETAELAGAGNAFDMLAALRDMGVTIAIDDYGTGLSTLDYLKKIPASEIKIDQSFVKGMLDNRSDLVMVQSTIALAHSLGRKVVAEGVERREALDTLVEMGCHVAQGFAIGRPTSLDSLLKRLTSHHAKVA